MTRRSKRKQFWSSLKVNPISAGIMIGIAFFIGSALNSGSSTDAAGNGTYLPIIKGGTGVGSLPNGVLVGNGTNPITTRSVDTSAISGSDNLITSDGVYSSILSIVYPIGSVYISTTATNPSSFMPGTTWEAYGTGKTLVGVDVSQPEFDEVGKSGGSKTTSHNHTITVDNGGSGTTGSTVLGLSQIPSHTHTFTTSSTSKPLTGVITISAVAPSAAATSMLNGSGIVQQRAASTSANWGLASTTYRAEVTSLVRGLDIDATHTHSGTTAATGGVNGHTHTIPAHSHAASSSDTSTSTLQPYITTYMWKRVN